MFVKGDKKAALLLQGLRPQVHYCPNGHFEGVRIEA
jgi:hypothetical protein